MSGAAVGLYGKLPAAGDFVSRILPASFIVPWDDWLQRALTASRAALGDRWTEIYLESPMWRFALQPQVCGPQAWAGVLMPSVDRTGRYFPLTLAAPIPPTASPLLTIAAAEHWFDQIEHIALAALSPDTTLHAVETKLAQQPLVALPADGGARADWEVARQLSSWWLQPLRPLSLRTPATQNLPAIAEFAAAQLMESQGQPRSLWWMRDEVAASISLRGWTGLPPPGQFAALLSAMRDEAR